MSHPNKIRGSRWESAVRDYLRGLARFLGISDPEQIERNGAVYGQNDRGDIRGIPDWTIECKDVAAIDLPGFLREAKVEQANAKKKWHAVVIKARRKKVEDAYVVMDMAQWVQIVSELSDGPHI